MTSNLLTLLGTGAYRWDQCCSSSHTDFWNVDLSSCARRSHQQKHPCLDYGWFFNMEWNVFLFFPLYASFLNSFTNPNNYSLWIRDMWKDFTTSLLSLLILWRYPDEVEVLQVTNMIKNYTLFPIKWDSVLLNVLFK